VRKAAEGRARQLRMTVQGRARWERTAALTRRVAAKPSLPGGSAGAHLAAARRDGPRPLRHRHGRRCARRAVRVHPHARVRQPCALQAPPCEEQLGVERCGVLGAHHLVAVGRTVGRRSGCFREERRGEEKATW
jgi:hypothetical protein